MLGMSSDVEGLSAEGVESAVSMRLLEAGLPILPKSHTAAQEDATLFATVRAVRSDASNINAFQVSLELTQRARLLRNPKISPSLAITWWDSSIGISTDEALPADVKEQMDTLVDKFAESFLRQKERP